MNHVSLLAPTPISFALNYVAQNYPAAADRVEQEIQEAIVEVLAESELGHFPRDIAPRRTILSRFSYLLFYPSRRTLLLFIIHGHVDLPKLI